VASLGESDGIQPIYEKKNETKDITRTKRERRINR
jgi:hypothetical protein